MAQTKGEGSEPKYKPVDAYARSEPPEWNDVLRGILVALVEKNSVLYQLRTAKDKLLDVIATQIATVLQNQDPKMNVWAVLEKWCWMMEMYARAVEFKFTWRYVNSMNFLTNSPASGSNVYIGSLTADRFAELTLHYATTPEEHTATTLVLSKKSRRFSSGSGLFLPELTHYAEISKKVTPPTQQPAPIAVVVSTSEGMAPVQLVASTAQGGFVLQGAPTLTTETTPMRGRRGRAVAKYSTRTSRAHQQQPAAGALPTSVADILNALSASVATTAAGTTTIKVEENHTLPSKQTPPESKNSDAFEWTKELTVALIEGVRARPDLWNSDIESGPHKTQMKEVVDCLKKIPGGKSLSVPMTSFAWRTLASFVHSPSSKLAVDFHLSREELRSRLQFLEKEGKANISGEQSVGSVLMAANGINGHDIQALQHILSLIPSEISPRENPAAQKRPRLASPGMRDPAPKKNSPSPQIVTTWVPPKEEAVKNAFGAVVASTSNPTATAQILSTSSGIPLFSVDHAVKEPKIERKSQVNGLGKRNSTHLDSRPDNGHKDDKWTTMGRLVEQTCRELETKDAETAILLQRELSEVLYRHQLQSLKKK